MQVELKSIQRRSGTTFLYVTHDQEEALTMSDRVAVMHSGRILQCDEPGLIFRRPVSRFVASFFKGCNVLRGRLSGEDSDRLTVALAGARVNVPRGQCREGSGGEDVSIGIRAENIRLGEQAAGCQVVLDGVLRTVMSRGTTTDHILELSDGQQLTATTTQAAVGAAVGRPLRAGAMVEDFMFLCDD